MKRKPTIGDVIRRATIRQLTKMQDAKTGRIHDGWTGHALATWVYPSVIRAANRHLKQKKPAAKKSRA